MERKQVLCVETGIIYPSICAAEAMLAVSRSGIRSAIRRGGKCFGYHWEVIKDGEEN